MKNEKGPAALRRAYLFAPLLDKTVGFAIVLQGISQAKGGYKMFSIAQYLYIYMDLIVYAIIEIIEIL